MDNLTHTLTGLLIADMAVSGSAWRTKAAPRQWFRDATFATSVLAHNLPDLDFVYTNITGGKLGYLLHHRGHTHTFLLALPQALLCYGLVVLVLRLARRRPSPLEHGIMLTVACLGPLFHLLMDYGNNYGIHPFWPFDNRWYYGDLVFIIEPWLLIGLVCATYAALRTRIAKGLLVAALVGLLGLAWVMPLIHPVVALALTVFAGVSLWKLARAGPLLRIGFGVVVVGALVGALLTGRREALALVREELAVEPLVATRSLAATPTPGNPLCWSILAVQHAGPTYRIRQAVVAPWPELWSMESCRWPATETTAPLLPATSPALPHHAERVQWQAEFRAPLAELQELYANDCTARALLRFTRAPFWMQQGDDQTLLGDLRYDREPEIGFTEMVLEPEAECPRNVPPWVPPLLDWMQ